MNEKKSQEQHRTALVAFDYLGFVKIHTQKKSASSKKTENYITSRNTGRRDRQTQQTASTSRKIDDLMKHSRYKATKEHERTTARFLGAKKEGEIP